MLPGKKKDVKKRRDYVVKSVSSRGDPKTPDGKENGEINPGDRSEYELRNRERFPSVELTVDEKNMMMCAEKDSGDQDRQYDRVLQADL